MSVLYHRARALYRAYPRSGGFLILIMAALLLDGAVYGAPALFHLPPWLPVLIVLALAALGSCSVMLARNYHHVARNK